MANDRLVTPENAAKTLDSRVEGLKRLVNRGFPHALDIESTNVCNLDCFFCPRKEAAKGIGLMDFGLFERIVDECRRHGPIGKIGLHKDGEPLAHPRIADMVRYIRDCEAAEVISFTSNGILMTPKRARALLEAGLNDVSFSIDAVSEATYAAAKGRKKYAVVEENVRRFIDMKPADVDVTVKFIRMQENEGEEQLFIEKWADSGANLLLTQYHDWSGSVRDSSLLTIAPAASFACENPWYSLAVNWDGKVSICCVDWDSQAVVGDANQASIEEIWHGQPLRRIRQLHLDGKSGCMSPCDACTYKDPLVRAATGGWLMEQGQAVLGIAPIERRA